MILLVAKGDGKLETLLTSRWFRRDANSDNFSQVPQTFQQCQNKFVFGRTHNEELSRSVTPQLDYLTASLPALLASGWWIESPRTRVKRLNFTLLSPELLLKCTRRQDGLTTALLIWNKARLSGTEKTEITHTQFSTNRFFSCSSPLITKNEKNRGIKKCLHEVHLFHEEKW